MLPKPHAGRSVDFLSQLGRATTGPIELDGALILLPVLRRLLTRVRRTWVGRVLPVDGAVSFHRLVGHTLFALCAVHGSAILIGYARASKPFVAQLASERALTGTALLAIFAVMWVGAWQVVRRSQLRALLLDAPALRCVVRARGRARAGLPRRGPRCRCSGWSSSTAHALRAAGRGPRSSSSRRCAPGSPASRSRGPRASTMRRATICSCGSPRIARHEWHPFTITSAPESAILTVHVRSLGNWTSALRRLAEAQSRRTGGELDAYVDGPYGSPSGHVFESRFAVLIGAGIGVTPFASILESIVLRANGRGERPTTLRRAHFFWINRDRYSFEWFAALLAELERIDGAGVLTVDLWMTGGRAGTTAAALELAREMARGQGERDVFTGLRTKTHVGHPDWDAILQSIAREHAPERVDVFFCGPPGLGKTVRRASARFGMRFRDEKF